MDDPVAPAAAAKKASPFLNTEQAARYLGLASGRALERMRRQGRGPSFRKHGRLVRYHTDDLLAWSQGQARTVTDTNRRGQAVWNA